VLNDLLEHPIEVLQNVVVPKSQYPISLAFQPCIATAICELRFGVLATVKLEHQSCLETHNVDDISPDRLLTLEFVSTQSRRAQPCP
jgi:hypothetical protein